jgi:hypothetical protein
MHMALDSIELNTVKTILSGYYPAYSEMAMDKAQSEKWMAAVESLESRLVLANVVCDSNWLKGPKMPPLKKDKALTLSDIEQSTLLLETLVLKRVSSQDETKTPFPLKDILADLLEFKASICSDPAFKLMFEFARDGVIFGVPQAYPEILAYGQGEKRNRSWYRYYGTYSSLLGVVKFDQKSIERFDATPDLGGENDGLIVLLYTYAYKSSSSKEQWESLISCGNEISERVQSIGVINTAMQAYAKKRYGI